MSPNNTPRPHPERLEELREDFNEIDDDGDGMIDFGEFGALMGGLDAGMSSEELRIGFTEIDTDRNGRISLAEFIAWRTG